MPRRWEAVRLAPVSSQCATVWDPSLVWWTTTASLFLILHPYFTLSIISWNRIRNGSGLKSARNHSRPPKKGSLKLLCWAHYDATLPLRLAGDASAFGLGVVLSHRFPDGSERPVAYASRTLTPSERNYSQLEKEALSLVYGVKKFHSYLYGRTFELLTDHKPLTTILGPKTGIPSIAAAQITKMGTIAGVLPVPN